MLGRKVFSLKKPFDKTASFEHDLENIRALRQRALLSPASPETIAEVLFSGWGRLRQGKPRVSLIDPGFRWPVSFVAVQQAVWQYLCLNALFFNYDGLAYLYLRPSSPERLTAVNATPWPNAEVVGEAAFSSWLSNFIWGTAWKGVYKRENPTDAKMIALKPLDFAPLIERGLRSLTPLGDAAPGHNMLKTLEFLDLLLRFRGEGSDEFIPYSVSLEKASLMEELDKKVEQEERPVLAAIEAYDHSRLGLTGKCAPTRITALAFRRHVLDGMCGGRESTLVELKLTIEALYGWQLDRRLLWKDRKEGIPLS